MYSALGHLARARPFTQEAADAYRELTLANPGRYSPDLAVTLDNLADTLSALGSDAEAANMREAASDARAADWHKMSTRNVSTP